MNQLTLTTTTQRPLRPLIEAALNNELRILETAIAQTERNLRDYETRFDMSSAQFLDRYENDELPETLEFVEWIGEYRMLSRLREKADAYRGISFVN